MERKKLFLVSLGHLSCDINGGALPAALPYIRAARNLDYQATGGLVLAYSCLSSIIQPLFGLLSDRLQKPWLIPLGIALAGCGMAMVGFMNGYWGMFAAIVASGIGSALFHPEGARFANKASGASKGAGLSLFSIGGNSGFILGPLLVAVFMGAFGPHGLAVFAVTALIMAALLFWQIAAMRVQGRNETRARAKPAAETAAGNAGARDMGGAPQTETPQASNNWREFGKLTAVIVSRAISFAGCNTFIPLYWVSVFGQSKATAAAALIIFGTCGVACNMLGGMLSDRYGYVRIIRTAFCIMPVVLLLFGIAENVVLACALLPLLGLALYLPFSSQVVLGQTLLAKNIGFASGVTLGLSTTLGGLAQPLLGWLADNFGLRQVFLCLACVSCIGLVFSFILAKEPKNAAA